jgi:hypothetical protein
MPGTKTSTVVLLVSGSLLTACASHPILTWPPWTQLLFALACISVPVLLHRLGVLKGLGVDSTPLMRFQRFMLYSVGFLLGAGVWVLVAVFCLPNPFGSGWIAAFLPAVALLGTSVFFLIKGLPWP